jgi:hypothetical protein
MSDGARPIESPPALEHRLAPAASAALDRRRRCARPPTLARGRLALEHRLSRPRPAPRFPCSRSPPALEHRLEPPPALEHRLAPAAGAALQRLEPRRRGVRCRRGATARGRRSGCWSQLCGSYGKNLGEVSPRRQSARAGDERGDGGEEDVPRQRSLPTLVAGSSSTRRTACGARRGATVRNRTAGASTPIRSRAAPTWCFGACLPLLRPGERDYRREHCLRRSRFDLV